MKLSHGIRWYNQTRMHSTLNYVSPAFSSRTAGTQQSIGKAVEKMKSKKRFPTFPQPRRRLRIYKLLRDTDSAGKVNTGR